MAAAPYFDLVREMKNAYNHRLRLVEHARQHGMKPTARAFATTVPTVRKWLRRFKQLVPKGLREHSRQALGDAVQGLLAAGAEGGRLRPGLSAGDWKTFIPYGLMPTAPSGTGTTKTPTIALSSSSC